MHKNDRDIHRFPIGEIFFSLASRPALGATQPPIEWVPGFPGGDAAGREADHSLSSGAEVNNGGVKPSVPNMSSWHCA
jgi:hypothetical protein